MLVVYFVIFVPFCQDFQKILEGWFLGIIFPPTQNLELNTFKNILL